MPISLTTDLDDILVTTSPGVTITGQITYEGTPPAAQIGANGQAQQTVRVSAQLPDPLNGGMVPTPPGVMVGQDLAFTLKGLLGEFLLRANGPGQYLKAVQGAGGEAPPGQGDRVTIVMTTQASTLE
jgi:hypothetical protein